MLKKNIPISFRASDRRIPSFESPLNTKPLIFKGIFNHLPKMRNQLARFLKKGVWALFFKRHENPRGLEGFWGSGGMVFGGIQNTKKGIPPRRNTPIKMSSPPPKGALPIAF